MDTIQFKCVERPNKLITYSAFDDGTISVSFDTDYHDSVMPTDVVLSVVDQERLRRWLLANVAQH